MLTSEIPVIATIYPTPPSDKDLPADAALLIVDILVSSFV